MEQKKLARIWETAKSNYLVKYSDKDEHLLNQMTLYDIDGRFCFLHTSSEYVYTKGEEIKQNIADILIDILKIASIIEEDEDEIEVFIKTEIADNMFDYKVEEVKKETRDNVINDFDTGIPDEVRFKNFVVGDNSKYAVAACEDALNKILNNEKPSYNPILIYGVSGVGKTHLVQAIGNEIIKSDSSKKVKYLTAEDFNNAYLSAIRKGGLRNTVETAENFRNIYRNLNLIIIDDIQFFEKVFGRGEGSVEEEFFHTFNALTSKGKQIIFVSDRKPKNIKGLSDRIKTRLSGGVELEIKKPEYITRMAIIEEMAAQQNVNISKDVISYIAENATDNVRELQGLFNRLIIKSKLLKINIDMDLAKGAVYEQVAKEKAKISAEKIVKEVCSYYNITEEELKSENRKKEILIPRQICMYIMKEKLTISLSEIGNHFNKNHTTVMNAIEKTKLNIDKDEEIKHKIEEIVSTLRD